MKCCKKKKSNLYFKISRLDKKFILSGAFDKGT